MKNRVEKNIYPKVMQVSDYPDFSDAKPIIRVVFMEKCGYFLAWNCAKTIKDAENEISSNTWKYARDIKETSAIEMTLDEICKALHKNIKIVKEH